VTHRIHACLVFSYSESDTVLVTSPTGAVAKYCDEVSVCLSVHEDIFGTICAIFTNVLCMLPMSVARSSSGMFMIGCITYRQEGGDRSAQHG